MPRTEAHVRRHLTAEEGVVYERFMRQFPHRQNDIPPYTTDGKPGEIESWVAAGEPAVWPPVAEVPVAVAVARPEPVAAWTAPGE